MRAKKWAFKWIIFTTFLFMMLLVPNVKAEETSKQYGILIAGEDGSYTFYDLNLAVGNQRIELNSTGKVMIPLRKVCSYLPGVTYQFDFTNRTATIINETTGKKLVLPEHKKYAYLYAKGVTKGTKVSLGAKSYASADSKALMVSLSSLKYILNKTTGYHYYNEKAIRAAGYDQEAFQGIIVYNLNKKVSSLPLATKVKYASQQLADNVVTVTIPEGYSVAQIVNRLVSKGVCVSTSALFQAVENVDLSTYSMFDGRMVDESVCFALEGYLYPDTYEFYKNSSPSDVIAKILNHSNRVLTAYTEAAKKQGFSLEDILCIASIIEKEASTTTDCAKVSSVLHQRLKKGRKLQCDCSIYYVERYIKPYITGDENRYNSFYNTYKCSALPSGPICSPGKKSITAALNPSDEALLYFATDDEGVYYYAANDEEWLLMKQQIEARNTELEELNSESGVEP